MQSHRQFKANLKLQGQPCGVCEEPFELGVDVSVCTACESNHHTNCWESHGGCSKEGCVNAPLKRMAEPPSQQGQRATPPGMKNCPSCSAVIHEMEQICPYCNAIATPDGIYHGPKANAPGATSSLVFGILGIFICGLIFGVLAIVKSQEAKGIIATDPRYGGSGLATAGLILGIIGIVGHLLVLMLRFGG